ncbi:MAG: hypothetical protein IJ439_06800 [Tyzzerella sp.]|nr:hypothetical protein [Tyzzerella sp.]
MGNNVLEEIQKIYSDVSEWVKFLEAKHAGLFAFWTALLIAVITSDVFAQMKIFWQLIVLVPIFIGSIINLISFIPFMNRLKWMRKKCYKKYSGLTRNAVFYCSVFVNTYSEEGDIDKSVEKYCKILKEYFVQDIEGKLSMDYMKQIIEVSTVATIKAYLFGCATIYIFGVSLIAVALLMIA